jgi:hypothetical protein
LRRLTRCGPHEPALLQLTKVLPKVPDPGALRSCDLTLDGMFADIAGVGRRAMHNQFQIASRQSSRSRAVHL